VWVLQVREALGARQLARLEAPPAARQQAAWLGASLGEAEAADAGAEGPVTGGGRRGDEHEAAGG
jgi:hypothetical protein